MITREDFQELNNHILNNIPDRVHIATGDWIPDALRKRLEVYLINEEIEATINVVVEGAVKTARAGACLAEIMTGILKTELPREARVKIQEALAIAGIDADALTRIGIKVEDDNENHNNQG